MGLGIQVKRALVASASTAATEALSPSPRASSGSCVGNLHIQGLGYSWYAADCRKHKFRKSLHCQDRSFLIWDQLETCSATWAKCFWHSFMFGTVHWFFLFSFKLNSISSHWSVVLYTAFVRPSQWEQFSLNFCLIKIDRGKMFTSGYRLHSLTTVSVSCLIHLLPPRTGREVKEFRPAERHPSFWTRVNFVLTEWIPGSVTEQLLA